MQKTKRKTRVFTGGKLLQKQKNKRLNFYGDDRKMAPGVVHTFSTFKKKIDE